MSFHLYSIGVEDGKTDETAWEKVAVHFTNDELDPWDLHDDLLDTFQKKYPDVGCLSGECEPDKDMTEAEFGAYEGKKVVV
jgi:hypothetical protein